MLNQVILVGKVKSIDLEYKVLTIIVSARDTEDVLVSCNFSENFVDTFNDYLNVNDVVGIKGRVGKYQTIEVEKVSFLSSASK